MASPAAWGNPESTGSHFLYSLCNIYYLKVQALTICSSKANHRPHALLYRLINSEVKRTLPSTLCVYFCTFLIKDSSIIPSITPYNVNINMISNTCC